jgi:hypothetical protein
MVISLYGARLPAIFYNYHNMSNNDDDQVNSTSSGSADDSSSSSGELWSYQNALLFIALGAVPLVILSTFWSVSYMLFRKEFTACPGK